MIKLVAMDIDGTLLDSNKNLSEENKKTVKEYEERGIKFTFSTGRIDNELEEVSSKMPYVKYGIMCNGAYVIDFENSEGNLGLANAIYQHLSTKLPVSRLQRDLTDSTVIRNIGVPMGHSVIAFQSTLKGLRKLLLHEESMQADLEKNWAVVAEGIQTILRREAYPNPYEALKKLTRTNNAITEKSISEFIDSLDVSDELKKELHQIAPMTYTGI